MKSPKIMFGYAGFLVACGLVAYVMASAQAKAATALIIPLIAAVLMILCGALASALHRNRTAGMIGIHAGLILPLLFAVAFGLRAFKTFDSGGLEKRYLAYILVVMTLGSLVAFVALLSTRPSKVQRTT